MSCFVSQAPALGALECQRSPGSVVDPELFAVAVAEIKLAQVTVQVSLAEMLVNAINATLQDREKSFDGVRMNEAAHVFVASVVDGSMRGKIPGIR